MITRLLIIILTCHSGWKSSKLSKSRRVIPKNGTSCPGRDQFGKTHNLPRLKSNFRLENLMWQRIHTKIKIMSKTNGILGSTRTTRLRAARIMSNLTPGILFIIKMLWVRVQIRNQSRFQPRISPKLVRKTFRRFRGLSSKSSITQGPTWGARMPHHTSSLRVAPPSNSFKTPKKATIII